VFYKSVNAIQSLPEMSLLRQMKDRSKLNKTVHGAANPPWMDD